MAAVAEKVDDMNGQEAKTVAEWCVSAAFNHHLDRVNADYDTNAPEAQDRRMFILGDIRGEQAILCISRGAFHQDEPAIKAACSAVKNVDSIQFNDIYFWYSANADDVTRPDLQLKLIYPCTEKYIRKYSAQPLRKVIETPETYQKLVRPWMEKQREGGRLKWVYNILDGITEVQDVIFRHNDPLTGFVLLPDSQWDRKTLGTLHLLVLTERRDLMSIRDLTKNDLPWLKLMYDNLIREVTRVYPALSKDEIQLYFHYQPTYYHMHIHITNVHTEPTGGQAIGKAITVEDVLSRLESLPGGKGMADISMTYVIGESSELWTDIFKT
ncbi:hypothetical protein KEM56_005905 [Ascosphaera pollenicola]|nr:hypothetical protein KEM56_005905 [Ascosphaera pollenicola]